MVFSDSQALIIYEYVGNNPDSKVAENLILRRESTGLTQRQIPTMTGFHQSKNEKGQGCRSRHGDQE